MRRVVTALVVTFLVGVLCVALLVPPLAERYGGDALRRFATTVGLEVTFDTFELHAVPPRLAATDLSVRRDGTLLAHVGRADIALDVSASIAAWHPVVIAQLDAPSFEFPEDSEADDEEAARSPAAAVAATSVEVRVLSLRHARLGFSMGDRPATVTADLADGSVLALLSGDVPRIELTLTNAALECGGQVLALDTGHAIGRFDHHGLVLESAVARGPSINAELTHPNVGTEWLQEIRGDFELPLIGVFAPNFEYLGGVGSFAGQLTGSLENPRVDGILIGRDVSFAGRPIGDLTTRLQHDHDDLSFSDIALRSTWGTTGGRAQLVFGDHHVFLSVAAQQATIQIAEALTTLGDPLPLLASFRGDIEARGPLDPLSLVLSARGTLSAPGARERDLSVAGKVREHGVDISATLDRGEREATGELHVAAEQLQGHVDVATSDLAGLAALSLEPVRDLGLAGTLKGFVDLAGTTHNLDIHVEADGRSATVLGVNFGDVEAALDIHGSELRISRCEIRDRDAAASCSGTVALTVDGANAFDATVRSIEGDRVMSILAEFMHADVPLRGGRASGQVGLRGSWKEPAVRASLDLVAPTLLDQRLQGLTSTVDLSPSGLRLDVAAVRTADERIDLLLRREPAGNVDASIKSTPWHFRGDVPGFADPVDATVTLAGEVRGNPLPSSGGGTIELGGFSFGKNVIGPSRVDVVLDGATARLKLTSNWIDGDATIPLDLARPARLDLNWRDLALSWPVFGGGDFSIHSSGAARLSGAPRDLQSISGEVEVGRLDLAHGELRWSIARAAKIALSAGGARVDQLEVVGADSSVELRGSASLAGAIDLSIDGAGDLSLLELWGDPIAAATGQARAHLRLQRDPGLPLAVHGDASLRDASLDLGLSSVPTAMSGELEFDGEVVRCRRLEGKLGGGRFSVVGEAQMSGALALDWRIERANLRPTDDLEVLTNATGHLGGTSAAPEVTGEITVLRAVYDRKIELADLFSVLRRRLFPRPRERQNRSPALLDLHLRAPGDIYLDNNIAKVEAAMDLRVSGPATRPSVLGTISILDGEVKFRERKFNIQGGNIDFRDPLHINPTLNIAADTRITTTQADYVINANVEGTAEEPRVVFSSDDPTLTQSDVLALVAFGATTDEIMRRPGGGAALNALTLVPNAFEENIVDLVGIDEFEVRAIEREDAGGVEPQVRVGKRLTNRLKASVATSIGVRNRRWVELEYDLTRRISLLGTWEEETSSEAGAFGGGIKFRYEFRSVPFSLLRQVDGWRPVEIDANE